MTFIPNKHKYKIDEMSDTGVSIILVITSMPDLSAAKVLAEQLVAEQLAACVQLVPGVCSIYRWKGQIEQSNEVQLQIKTSSQCINALHDRIVQLHPYELPEIIAVKITDSLPAYLTWVLENTSASNETKTSI